MKFKDWSIQTKLTLTYISIALITLLFALWFGRMVYESIYVGQLKKTLMDEGNSLLQEYDPAKPEDFPKLVDLASRLSKTMILYTNNPRELGACIPFEGENEESIINLTQRKALLRGETVVSMGYNRGVNRSILAVAIPHLDEKRKLLGILFLYIPLATISETFAEMKWFWFLYGVAFYLLAILLSWWISRRISSPIRSMDEVAQAMAEGNYGKRVEVTSHDEIGHLGEVLNRLSTNLEEVENKRREFTANLSHELRTPLSYISGYSEALLEGKTPPEKEREYLEIVHRESLRLKRLVNDMLDLAQLEGENYPLKKDLFPFAQLVEEAVQPFRAAVEKKRQTLSLNLDPSVILEGDRDRLNQVIQNLVDNAVKYTPEGGEIAISLREEGEWVILEISDSGIGIPPESLPRIGERFYRVDRSRSRRQGGTGIGVAIVKRILNNHGGMLQYESRLGEGTKATVKLPRWREKGE
ncbi:Histidine kinase [[Clostridium] ultunense Esp]|uniref:sensor histidine kinase n=1 Tax=Thermicanus aegyptius TaxID=94009 RepID=UPI0002B70837|nr:ATP-binding protein [Thermicanus aegyptius]CCQ93445.1 Histidine kinase [[Clostridium] ultunense Esp]